ncbi:MAG: DUF3466 family protein [Sedimentisphaerales bacterium]|nr:DUF3466 family protein [Sedimentisphaerales bacterium]
MSKNLPALLISILLLTGLCSAGQYEIIDLGPQSGFYIYIWRPLSINDMEQVVGTSPQEVKEYNAFIWENDQTRYIPADDENQNWANGISSNSIIVGGESDGFNTLPFYEKDGSKTYLPTLPNKLYGEAMAANANGVIVGYVADIMSSWLSTAAIWQDGELFTLPKLSAGDTYNMAVDINDNGQIIGYSGSTTSKQAFLWQDDQIQDLGTLSGDVGAMPEAINNDGVVVGYSLDGGNLKKAFLWENGVMVSLPHNGVQSQANGINDERQAAGTVYISDEESFAVLWENNSMLDLNSQLPEGSGWILSQADDINDAGWIVGVGTNPEGESNHGFLMIPVSSGEVTSIEADLDIRPDVLNWRSMAWFITCRISLPESYDVVDIDSSSILLNGVLSPFYAKVYEEDQILKVKFSQAEVQDMLEPGYSTLTVTGQLVDGTVFTGEDTIRLFQPERIRRDCPGNKKYYDSPQKSCANNTGTSNTCKKSCNTPKATCTPQKQTYSSPAKTCANNTGTGNACKKPCTTPKATCTPEKKTCSSPAKTNSSCKKSK